jgi:hypothetical protein
MSKEGRAKRRIKNAVIAFIVKFMRGQRKDVDYVFVRKERQKHTTKKHIGRLKKSVMNLWT